MTIEDTEPVFLWCSAPATITKAQIFLSTTPGRSSKIIDEATTLSVDNMSEITLPSLDSVLKEGVSPTRLKEIVSIGVNVSFENNNDHVKGTFIAQYEVSHEDLENWQSGIWMWPTAEKSKRACGMPSSRQWEQSQ